jgi:hypothetical protein
MKKTKDSSHLMLLETATKSPKLYGRLFEFLADQHETLEHNAWDLFQEILDHDIDPAELEADGALLQLGLADLEERIDSIDGELPPVRYLDSREQREKERVKAILLGYDVEEDQYE